ncbi:hypothetical protein PG985_008612 [Apiospora marii]|uniref:uncharacterized protein n=1 Tax=Apiospora marii TaxID=335849 RepID=UPI00312D8355
MLWNWDTIDACFLTSTWRITTQAIFAGTCIGVILLAMTLLFLRRAHKEYDAYLLRKYDKIQAEKALQQNEQQTRGVYRSTALEQAVRALLYTLQFANAYIVMLLAMYYNGYIIVCIFIGAFLGSFIFTWDALGRYDDYP